MNLRSQKALTVLAIVVCGGLFASGALGQVGAHRVESLETLTANAEAVVRGVFGDATGFEFPFKVLETLKGEKKEPIHFSLASGGGLGQLKACRASKTEALVFLLAHNGWQLVELGSPEGKLSSPLTMTTDLRLPKTVDELLKAVREVVAEQKDAGAMCGVHTLQLPPFSAFNVVNNGVILEFVVPIGRKLESTALRLIESPDDFLAKSETRLRDQLRLEGVKALRHFPTEKNLALIRRWLDDPTMKARNDEVFLPRSPQTTTVPATLPTDLATLPEVFFQAPLAKKMSTADAQFHTACIIDMIHFFNQRKTDGFMETLTSKRPDLAGLPFVMGDACRMKPDASERFMAARLELLAAKAALGGYGGMTDTSARVAAWTQMLGTDSSELPLGLVDYLEGEADVAATHALAKLAIFSQEANIRQAAVRALKLRRDGDYTDILVSGLNYPWPQVAQRAADAIGQLGRSDLVPKLIDVLDRPDPRAPQVREVQGKKTTVVRELVRINHHHNCLLCHAPATANRDGLSKEETEKLAPLTAQIPVSSEAMNAYYSPNVPDILVRFDVTYLRQDFSLNLPVADAAPWPEMQRYDFVVRTRELTEQEATEYRNLLRQRHEETGSPYHAAAQTALRQLTGREAEARAVAWRKVLQ